MRAVQLFAGTGTMTRAFQNQGVRIILAQESREALAQVYKTNFPEVPLIEDPVESMQLSQFPDYELLLVQIHISAYQLAEKENGPAVEISQIKAILSVVRETSPSGFCIFVSNGSQARDICREQLFGPLSREDYYVMFRQIRASELGGVPFAGQGIYAIGCKPEFSGEQFCLPRPVMPRSLGPWYLQKEINGDELYRRIPEDVEKFILERNGKPGAIYCRQYRTRKERAEGSTPYQVIECEECPKLIRRSWYDTYVQTGQGIRRLSWKEYLILQGDDKTIFPANMSTTKIWECLTEHGIYPVENRIAQQLVRALQKDSDEDNYEDEKRALSESIAAQFLRTIPDFTRGPIDKRLGMIRMPVGTGKSHCIGLVARGILKLTNARWKIMILCPNVELSYQMEKELREIEMNPAVRIQNLEDLRQYMADGEGGIFITTCIRWEKYTEQFAGQNHNGLCLICYEADRCLSSLRYTPKYLPQACYIGISSYMEEEPLEKLVGFFGEIKAECRMSEVMSGGWMVPLYEEVFHQEQNAGILSEAGVRQAFALEIFKDNLWMEKDERALVVLESQSEATEFCGDLFRMKSACMANLFAAAEEFGLQPEILRKRLEESDYFILTSAERSTDEIQTLRKFRDQRRGILVAVSMWRDLDVAEISTAYVKGSRDYNELSELSDWIVRAHQGKHRARIVFCGSSCPEFLKDRVSAVLPEMQKLVQNLWDGDYPEGYRSLEQLKSTTGVMGRTVERELDFLYPLGYSQQKLQKLWTEQEKELRLFCDVWCLTSQYAGSWGAELLNGACCAQNLTEEAADAMEEQEEEPEVQSAVGREYVSSYEQGAFLEKAVMELLHLLFRLDEEYAAELESQLKIRIDTMRRQKSGSQGGYDIRVVYRDAMRKKRVCLFECKNKRVTEITIADIAGKLEQVKSGKEEVEHWILVAPGAKLANDVYPYLERMEKHPGSQLPVRDVQVWTEENGVKELFGLVPSLYHEIYGGNSEDKDAPEGWSDSRRKRVWEDWKNKLLPVALLPEAFLDYPEKTERLLFDVYNDKNLRSQYEDLYKRYIKLRYFDDEGRYVDRYLETDLEKWIFQKDHRIKILLGEFGDGKTFFLYSFGRRLMEIFRENPAENYLPICFSLKRMGEARTPSEFIEERMRELGADRADFLELKQKYHVLICLDGLDEMSPELDRRSLLRNTKQLIKCCNELQDVKILITSRRQCFMSYEIRDMLREGLGGFSVWQLAPVTEEDVKKHLYPILQDAQEDVAVIPEHHRWMALAGKPLFFEMLQDLLADQIFVGESENAIYDVYIRKCLQRKFDESFERSDMWVKKDETIQRIYQALEEMAVKMQRRGQERLRIDELPDFLDEPMAEILWKDKEADEQTMEDAQNRFSMRLLFKSEGSEEISFAHRSIREYFVGKYLLNLLKEETKKFLQFVEQYSCNYEVLGFLAEGIREGTQKELVDKLISILPECHTKKSSAAATILQICFLVDKKIPKGEWAGQNLEGVFIPGADFSGQNLSHSRLRNANLNNVRLDDTDCSYCDFTGSRLEETESVEAVRQSGQKLRVIYADGLVRDWKTEYAESCVCWTGQNRFEKACLLERGWIVREAQGQNELFRKEPQIKAAMQYWDWDQAEILDIAGDKILLTVRREKDEFLTAAVDYVKNEVRAFLRTEGKPTGKLCGDRAAVMSDGEKVCIFDWEKKQEYSFPLQVYGQKEIAVREGEDHYDLAVLAEGKVILVSCQNGGEDIRKKEHLLPAEGVNHIALVNGKQIAYGSHGGTVFLVPVNWQIPAMNWESRQELHLGIYCRNMKTEGIIPEEIRRRLEIHCRVREEE